MKIKKINSFIILFLLTIFAMLLFGCNVGYIERKKSFSNGDISFSVNVVLKDNRISLEETLAVSVILNNESVNDVEIEFPDYLCYNKDYETFSTDDIINPILVPYGQEYAFPTIGVNERYRTVFKKGVELKKNETIAPTKRGRYQLYVDVTFYIPNAMGEFKTRIATRTDPIVVDVY